MKLQVEWIIRFSNDSICIFLFSYIPFLTKNNPATDVQSLQLPIPSGRFPSSLKERKSFPLRLTLENWPIVSYPPRNLRRFVIHAIALDKDRKNVQTYKDETVSRPFREKTKWMDKCSTFKSSLSKSHRFYICNSFWKKPLNPWPRKGGGNTLFNPVCTHEWMDAAWRKAWLSVTTRKTQSYPPHTRTTVVTVGIGGARVEMRKGWSYVRPPLIRLTRPIG